MGGQPKEVRLIEIVFIPSLVILSTAGHEIRESGRTSPNLNTLVVNQYREGKGEKHRRGVK